MRFNFWFGQLINTERLRHYNFVIYLLLSVFYVYHRLSWGILYLTIILLKKTSLWKYLLCAFFLLVLFENVLRNLKNFIWVILLTIYSWFIRLNFIYRLILITENLFHNRFLIDFNILIFNKIVIIFHNRVSHMFIRVFDWKFVAQDIVLITEGNLGRYWILYLVFVPRYFLLVRYILIVWIKFLSLLFLMKNVFLLIKKLKLLKVLLIAC